MSEDSLSAAAPEGVMPGAAALNVRPFGMEEVSAACSCALCSGVGIVSVSEAGSMTRPLLMVIFMLRTS